MSYELKEGLELATIYWEGDDVVRANGEWCKSLTVRMQPGFSGDMPWCEAIYDDGHRHLYNLAKAQGVSFAPPKDG